MKLTKFIAAVFAVAVGALVAPAFAQQSTRPCFYNASGQCVYVSATNPLPVTGGGGGGGGTSATDASTFTTGTTAITPGGGLFNDSATLTSGQTGAARLTTKRAQIVDVDTAGNALYSALTGPIPAGTNNIGNVGGATGTTPTDCSGTITTGGTAQNAFTAGSTKHGFTIVNLDTTEPLWISFTTTAAANTAGSYPLQAPTASTFASPGSFTAPVGFGINTALSVIAATTGHKFSCTWW